MIGHCIDTEKEEFSHERKPQEMRDMIEKVSYSPRIELFAREQHYGWDVWCNEVDGDVRLINGHFVS